MQDGYFSKTRLQCLGDGPPDFGGAVAWRARLEAGQAEKFGYEAGKVRKWRAKLGAVQAKKFGFEAGKIRLCFLFRPARWLPRPDDLARQLE